MTGCWVPKAHRCTRAMKAIPSSPNRHNGLLWHKSQKILMIFMGGTCHNAQCITPCCTWSYVTTDWSVSMLTPVHHRQQVQRTRKLRNWTLATWSDEPHFLLNLVKSLTDYHNNTVKEISAPSDLLFLSNIHFNLTMQHNRSKLFA